MAADHARRGLRALCVRYGTDPTGNLAVGDSRTEITAVPGCDGHTNCRTDRTASTADAARTRQRRAGTSRSLVRPRACGDYNVRRRDGGDADRTCARGGPSSQRETRGGDSTTPPATVRSSRVGHGPARALGAVARAG